MIDILYSEKDKEFREYFSHQLEDKGFHVETVSNTMDAIEHVVLKNFDLIISAQNMDEIDGLQFLSYVKKVKPETKTMILTSQPTSDSEYQALNLSINKYLSKETRQDVLLKHVEVLVEEASRSMNSKRFLKSKKDKVELDLRNREVKKDGEIVHITPKEFDIISLLLENIGQPVSRECIIANFWDKDKEEVDTRVVDVHIKSIRKKLAIGSIVTVRKYGYKWEL